MKKTGSSEWGMGRERMVNVNSRLREIEKRSELWGLGVYKT